MIGIIAAMRAEARTAQPLVRAGHRLVISGMGAERARAAAQKLVDSGAERLLVWGTAGALHAELAPGCLMLPKEVLSEDGKRHAVTTDWHAHLRQLVATNMIVNSAALISVSHPVSGHAAKVALSHLSGAVAVDMESAAIAAVALKHDVPFAVVRTIADPLELELPPVLLKSRYGRFLALEVMLRLCARPQDLRALMRLSRTMRTATQSLSSYARTLAVTGTTYPLY